MRWEPNWATPIGEMTTEDQKKQAWRLIRQIGARATFYPGGSMTVTQKDGKETPKAQQTRVHALTEEYATECEKRGTPPEQKEYLEVLTNVLNNRRTKKQAAQTPPDSIARLAQALIGAEIMWDTDWQSRPRGYEFTSTVKEESKVGALAHKPASIENRAYYFAPIGDTRTGSDIGMASMLTKKPEGTTKAFGLIRLRPRAARLIKRKDIQVIMKIPRLPEHGRARKEAPAQQRGPGGHLACE